MAKLTLGQKAERVLRMLMGLGNARIATAMGAFGMKQDDIEEGWALLRATSTARASRIPETSAGPGVAEHVDAWENRWYPIIDASLRRRFPEVHGRVFHNLSQTEGPSVLIGVRILLDRLADLEKATDRPSKEARALLRQRGLTKAVIEEAETYLHEATIPAEPVVLSEEESSAALAEAESALWGWYLEWSQIARVAVRDGRLLAQLGFGAATRRGRRPAADEGDDDAAEGEPSPAGPTD